MPDRFDPERFLKKPTTTPREKIIVAAFDLFHARGIEGTSVDDILKKSDTGKSQFYHYFKSKDGLVHDLMDMAYQKVKDGEIEGIEPVETWDDLKAWFEGCVEKVSYFNYERGCPIGKFANNIEEGDDHLRVGVSRVFDAMKSFPKEFFIKLKARGELKPEADPEELADFCISVTQGACMLGRLEKSDKAMKAVLEHGFRYVKAFVK